MLNLVTEPLVVGGLAFLAGSFVARFLLFLQTRKSEKESTSNDRLLRSLEADLRVANKNLEKANEELQSSKDELDSVKATVVELQALLEQRNNELEETSNMLKSECAKTHALREDLSNRAEDTIRAEVHARQMEVELSVVKAGSSAVHEEVDRLAAERQELTGRLRQLEDEFLRAELDDEDEDGLEEPLDLDEPLIGL